eukprot:651075-Lingulodinium_polyedra.AAC.1
MKFEKLSGKGMVPFILTGIKAEVQKIRASEGIADLYDKWVEKVHSDGVPTVRAAAPIGSTVEAIMAIRTAISSTLFGPDELKLLASLRPVTQTMFKA